MFVLLARIRIKQQMKQLNRDVIGFCEANAEGKKPESGDNAHSEHLKPLLPTAFCPIIRRVG